VAAIHAALVALRDSGAAVVVMSEDLQELLSLSDQVTVLYRGKLSAPMPVAEATPERLGLLMAGAQAAPAETDDAA
jgi:simple sugar transport system ATP-binding protein